MLNLFAFCLTTNSSSNGHERTESPSSLKHSFANVIHQLTPSESNPTNKKNINSTLINNQGACLVSSISCQIFLVFCSNSNHIKLHFHSRNYHVNLQPDMQKKNVLRLDLNPFQKRSLVIYHTPTSILNFNPFNTMKKLRLIVLVNYLSCHITYLNAPNPPNKAPDAIPTQKPIINPTLILSQQLGPVVWQPAGRGIVLCSKTWKTELCII